MPGMKGSSFKLSAPLPLARAAAPLSPAELHLLASTRILLSDTESTDEVEDAMNAVAFGAAQLCEAFAAIRAHQRRAPVACVALAVELRALADQNPALCEVFFQEVMETPQVMPSSPINHQCQERRCDQRDLEFLYAATRIGGLFNATWGGGALTSRLPQVGAARTHSSSAWDEAMDLVRDCTSAEVVEKVVDALVCVVLQVPPPPDSQSAAQCSSNTLR